jgi:hypothetical protein
MDLECAACTSNHRTQSLVDLVQPHHQDHHHRHPLAHMKTLLTAVQVTKLLFEFKESQEITARQNVQDFWRGAQMPQAASMAKLNAL